VPVIAPPPDPAPPDSAKGKGGGGSGKGGGKGKGAGLDIPFVPLARAAAAEFDETNRVLYEFGEIMRRRAHASDNAGCVSIGGACTVTVKY
jgi:hypothetical protein